MDCPSFSHMYSSMQSVLGPFKYVYFCDNSDDDGNDDGDGDNDDGDDDNDGHEAVHYEL